MRKSFKPLREERNERGFMKNDMENIMEDRAKNEDRGDEKKIPQPHCWLI